MSATQVDYDRLPRAEELARHAAGPVLDTLVARFVLGYKYHAYRQETLTQRFLAPPADHAALVLEYAHEFICAEGRTDVPILPLQMALNSFSLTWAGAGVVMQHLADRYWWRIQSPFEQGDSWAAGLTPLGTTGWNGRPDIQALGATGPEAVCKGALLQCLAVQLGRQTMTLADANP